MRKRFLASLFLLVTLVGGTVAFAPAASAAELAQPGSVRCDRAIADEVTAKKKFDKAKDAAGTLKVDVSVVADLNKQIKDLDSQIADLLDNIPPGDASALKAELKVTTGQRDAVQNALNAKAELDKAREKRERVCATTPPSSTSTPAPTPAPKDEFDCQDFPLEDGTTAQQLYDRDHNDPNKLDRDGDGVACEINEDFNNDSSNDSNDDGNLSTDDTPSGGVETGNGVERSPVQVLAGLLMVLVAGAGALTGLRRALKG
jgi:excalibur calcium-binding domain-containing protein